MTIPLVDEEEEEKIITSKKRVNKQVVDEYEDEDDTQPHGSNSKKSAEQQEGYGTEPDITPARPEVSSRVGNSPSKSPVLNDGDSPKKTKDDYEDSP